MSLIKCPDCEKMISPRAQQCPFCGCPADFFNNMEQNEKKVLVELADETTTSEQKEKVSLPDNKVNEEEIPFTEFCFLGRTIRYYEREKLFINMMKLHNKTAAVMERELRNLYKKVNDIDKVWDEVIPAAKHVIAKIIKENLGLLYHAGINMREEQFIQKHNIDIDLYIKPIMDDYDQVIESANYIKNARRIERSSRSQWEGGGFGLKGAIKGAITAGALNAVTGAGRAIGDSAVDSTDNAKIRDAKKKIYENEDYQEKIFYGFRRCVAEADIGLAKDLAEKGVTDYVKVDFIEATEIFTAALEYEKNESRLVQKMIDAILIYPLCTMYYGKLIYEVIIYGDEAIDNIIKFMDFWDMNEDFPEIFEEEPKRKAVVTYLNQHPEIKDINFELYDVATYVKIRDAKIELEKAAGSKELPSLVFTCFSIKSYLEKCLEESYTLDSINVLKDLKEDDSAEIFIKKMHDEKVLLPGLLKGVWLFGDTDTIPENKIKNKWGIPESDTIFMYQNKAIFGTLFGGKGFVLTRARLYDLKNKVHINLREITSAKYDIKGIIVVTNGQQEIEIDISDEKPATKRFFYRCFEEFVHRYADFTEEQQHEKAVSTTIFCIYCGKKIRRDVKFCNFCGENNSYSRGEIRG